LVLEVAMPPEAAVHFGVKIARLLGMNGVRRFIGVDPKEGMQNLVNHYNICSSTTF
jgi:hypothetical protein